MTILSLFFFIAATSSFFPSIIAMDEENQKKEIAPWRLPEKKALLTHEEGTPYQEQLARIHEDIIKYMTDFFPLKTLVALSQTCKYFDFLCREKSKLLTIYFSALTQSKEDIKNFLDKIDSSLFLDPSQGDKLIKAPVQVNINGEGKWDNTKTEQWYVNVANCETCKQTDHETICPECLRQLKYAIAIMKAYEKKDDLALTILPKEIQKSVCFVPKKRSESNIITLTAPFYYKLIKKTLESIEKQPEESSNFSLLNSLLTGITQTNLTPADILIFMEKGMLSKTFLDWLVDQDEKVTQKIIANLDPSLVQKIVDGEYNQAVLKKMKSLMPTLKIPTTKNASCYSTLIACYRNRDSFDYFNQRNTKPSAENKNDYILACLNNSKKLRKNEWEILKTYFPQNEMVQESLHRKNFSEMPFAED